MKIVTLILLIIPFNIWCQTNVEVHYKSEILIDFDTLQGPERFKQVFKNSVEKSKLIDFVLLINVNDSLSLFKKDDLNDPSISKMDLLTISQILEVNGKYINSKRKLIHDYFLLEKNLKVEVEKTVNWILTKEVKKIGDYTCLKAIGTIEYGKSKNETVEAWYTASIPLPYGPKTYHGLPGLILEIKEKNHILYLDKIKFISDEIKIIAPEKKDIISEKQANSIIKIANKKAEEYFKN